MNGDEGEGRLLALLAVRGAALLEDDAMPGVPVTTTMSDSITTYALHAEAARLREMADRLDAIARQARNDREVLTAGARRAIEAAARKGRKGR